MKKDLVRFIECSLIGDGSIVPRERGMFRFQLGSVNRTYAEWVRRSLEELGLSMAKISVSPGRERVFKQGIYLTSDYHQVLSKVTEDLGDLRVKWYPQGVKVFPLDFRWDWDAVERLLAEDGNRNKRQQIIYWGVKSDAGFETLGEFLKSRGAEVSEWKKHPTSGRILAVQEIIKSLPGFESKGI